MPSDDPVTNRDKCLLQQASSKALRRRRRALRDSGYADTGLPAEGALGIAFSGGGIRSATISLGISQALMKNDRLLDFDYASTVSGGGYFGSFLTSLFLPECARGTSRLEREGRSPEELEARRQFAEMTLKADARKVFFDKQVDPVQCARVATHDSQTIRNPIWWLREHSRYLAPNGPTDYAAAATHYVRNWLSMIYVFALPLAVLFALSTQLNALIGAASKGSGWLAGVWNQFPGAQCLEPTTDWVASNGGQANIFFYLAVVAVALSMSSGLAYWATEWMPCGPQWEKASKIRNPKLVYGVTLLVSAIAICLAEWLMYRHIYVISPCPQFLPIFLQFAIFLYVGSIVISLVIFTMRFDYKAEVFANGLRQLTNRAGAWFNQAALLMAALGAIDFMAIHLRDSGILLWQNSATGPSGKWLLPVVAPAAPFVAWLIHNLPMTDAAKGGWLSKFAGRHVWMIALIAGIASYSLLAVLIDTLVQFLLMTPESWNPKSPVTFIERFAFLKLFCVLLFFLFITGFSTGFINLSSLHNLYTSRLTRAYLGGSNRSRLREVVKTIGRRPVTEYHPKDDIDVAVYQRTPSAAPLHLINITLNETRNREGSQLVERDRKGLPLVFAPEGVLLDAARDERLAKRLFFSWNEIWQKDVEALTVGQLCAISGAAASPGMGANTTLGGALALTFANVRLGYWWKVNSLPSDPEIDETKSKHAIRDFPLRLVRTYTYLWNEMTGRYSRDYERLYLSDGGHFDNSGVYELLRRKVPLIVACDNGADPNFAFDDLENLIRKVRLDMGMSINVASPEFVREKFGKKGATFFFNGKAGNWRDNAQRAGGSAAALLLNVSGWKNEERTETALLHHIIWLKPRVTENLTNDIQGYGLNHPDFPHETTSDQFFDEAQWESYRGLGETLIRSLFITARGGSDCLRNLAKSFLDS